MPDNVLDDAALPLLRSFAGRINPVHPDEAHGSRLDWVCVRRADGRGLLDPPLLALILCATVLGCVRLGAKSVWLDEATSVVRARVGLGTLAHVLTNGDSDTNMSAYYVLLHFWVRVFGDSEVAVRSLSVLFAVLAVPATYFVGQRLFGRFAGLVASLLLTVNAFFVQFAQEARSYSLVVFLVTLSSYFFVVELERPSLVNRIGYVATSALAFYAHYFAAYVVLAQLVTLVAFRRRAALTKQWLTAAAAILLLCTPELVFAQRAGRDPIAGIGRPAIHDLLAIAVDLAGGSRTLLLLFAASSCYAAAFAFRKRMRWRYGFLIAWLLVPILLSFALSFVQPMFLSRYVIVSLPALMLLAAAGLAQVRSRVLAGSLLLLLVWLSGFQLAQWYRRGSHEDWRNATKFVLAGMLPGDGIVLYPSYARKPFEYYERQNRASGPENLQGQDLRSTGKRRIWFVLRVPTPPRMRRTWAGSRSGYATSTA